MLPRMSSQFWYRPQTGRNTPDLDFFDSDNFQLLERTQDRKEERQRHDRIKARQERSRRGPLVDTGLLSPELGYYSQLFCRDGNPKPKKVPAPPQTYFGLRRPLNASEQRVVAAMPGYEKDHKEWADKPYSTVYQGWNGYKGIFPLLMQLNSESEDKDVTMIQTETRRMSMVTTDYSKGTIKLADGGEEIKYAVFPILHRVVESEEEEDDDDDEEYNDGDDTQDESDADDDRDRAPNNRPPPLLPREMLDRLEAIAAQRNDEEEEEDSDESEEAEPPPGWLEHRNTRMHAERRLSITTRPCAEKPRMLKRRSLDFGSLFYHHEVKEVDNMDSITEDADDDDHDSGSESTMAAFSSAPPAGTWALAAETKEREGRPARSRDLANIRRKAEQEMDRMDANLTKLENFLKSIDDD